jgi:hypothetical protein
MTPFVSDRATVVCLRDDIPSYQRDQLDEAAAALGAHLIYVGPEDLGGDLLELSLPHLFPKPPKALQLLGFYSPSDYLYALGRERWLEALHTARVRQKTCVSGRVGNVVLRDLFGWAPRNVTGIDKDAVGLKKFALTLGLEVADKGLMTDYKECMWRGLLNHPAEFLRYAVWDARVLLDIYDRFVAFLAETLREALGFELEDIWPDGPPPTPGRLVADVFEHWLYRQAGEHETAMRFCARKLGYLDPDAQGDGEQALGIRAERAAVLERCRTPEALAELLDSTDAADRHALKRFGSHRYQHTAINAAGVRVWASQADTETAVFLALIQGGRCVNERSDQYRIGEGLDIDIVGAYGSNLRSLEFPVGLPSVWSFKPNDRRPTLGKWLREHERDLVDNLWIALVRGKLSFDQDLLMSKLVKASAIRRAAPADGDDPSSDFALLRRFVEHGVIETRTLEMLGAVASPNERREIMRLELVTAAAYLRQHRVADVGAWCRAVLADRTPGAPRLSAGISADLRTRAWFAVPLEGFIGRFVDLRKRYKAQARANPTDETVLKGKSEVLKLFVNTTYGDFATRFFGVSNPILANVITARARCAVWMLAKALGLRMSVTDGGPFEPSAVPWFADKKPGLATLSRMADWADARRGRRLIPLPGLSWRYGEPLPADAAHLAREHVRRFWDKYGLNFEFELEVKEEHTFRAAGYWNKADICMLTAAGPVYKIRGKERRNRNRGAHPLFALLRGAAEGKDDFPEQLTYTHRQPLNADFRGAL